MMSKAMSFAAVHFTVAYHFHEKAWNRLSQVTHVCGNHSAQAIKTHLNR